MLHIDLRLDAVGQFEGQVRGPAAMTSLDDLTCAGCGRLPVDYRCGCTDPVGGIDPHAGWMTAGEARDALGLPDVQVEAVRVSWDPDPWRHPIQRLRTWRIRRRIRQAELEAQRRRESSDPVERVGQKLSDAIARTMDDELINGRRER